MKIIQLIFTLVLISVGLIPTAIVQAAPDLNRLITHVPSLKIKTDPKIEINLPFTVTIFGKDKSDVIAGASVYALPSQHAVIRANKSDNYTSLINKYEEIATSKGIIIGTTDESGKTTGILDKIGSYLLVALKNGYKPGFSHIKVIPVSRDGLVIEAPEKAYTDETVTILVKGKQSGSPVADVIIYALRDKTPIDRFIKHQPVDNGTATQIITEILPAHLILKEESDNLSSKWITEIVTLGKTGNDGELSCTFDRTGAYTLFAIKENYKLDRCHIKILPQPTIKEHIIQNRRAHIVK